MTTSSCMVKGREVNTNRLDFFQNLKNLVRLVKTSGSLTFLTLRLFNFMQKLEKMMTISKILRCE